MDFAVTVLPVLSGLRDILMPHWGNVEVLKEKGAGAHDIVTELDIAVEERTRTELAELYPDIAFVGEEGGGDRTADRLWLMDPIDGTGHYLRGLPFCTSMLAYIEAGQVRFSAIYDFVNDRVYWAERGKGAYCNGDRLGVSNRKLRESYVAWESNQSEAANRELTQLLRQETNLFNSINAGWEMAMVASGKLDARICFEPYGKDYDFAPGSLLVEEAGGVVANVGTTTYDYRNTSFIAAGPTLYQELTEGERSIFPITR
ncbi:MAG TPA: inositol monophosphatase [Candidatus Paceibacterota bacterium]|nr:inositol monophosphatase [Candidatus Paceibacterota bacterium]